MSNRICIGNREFDGKIDITDPCYNKTVWCRMNDVEVKPGNYFGYIETNSKGRVSLIGIYLDDDLPTNAFAHIGDIGVDAGLAGFFENKPDYSSEEWVEICEKLRGKNWALLDDGFVSLTGYGDGEYPVWASKNDDGKVVALEIKFM